MALGISSGIRSYFGPKLSKQSTSNVSSLSTIELSEKKAREDQGLVDVLKESNTQSGSRFLHILPFEIRQIIYDYVWDAHGRQYHIHLRNGRLIHARCVMNHRDDDLDFIQKEMDRIHGSEHFDEFRNDRLRMWYRRLVSPWGRRHWRCKERLNYANLQKDGCRSVDETSWVNLMLVCKRMYPEVMESIFQFHRFIFNDIPSAQKFFILRPSPFIAHLRHLDLTLSAPMLEYSPFVDEDEHKSSCLLAISQVLANAIYLHDLRLSFDVWDRQFWTQIPEKVLLKEFGKVNILERPVVELPPILPTETHSLMLGPSEGCRFRIQRRSIPRYWLFPPYVERINWKVTKTCDGRPKISSESNSCIMNPYQDDHSAR